MALAKIIPVPTLSFSGWVRSTAEKADYLFCHFYESERSQTFIYKDRVSSLQYIIQKNKLDIQATCREIEATLSAYFSAYFPTVRVEIDYQEVPVNSGKITIRMYISLTDVDGKEFNMSRLADIVDSKFDKVRKLVNDGPSI